MPSAVSLVVAIMIWYGATAINSFSSKELVNELQPQTTYECVHFTLLLTLCQAVMGVIGSTLLTGR